MGCWAGGWDTGQGGQDTDLTSHLSLSLVITTSHHRLRPSHHHSQPLITIRRSNKFLNKKMFFWFQPENLINCLCVAEANQDFLSGGNIYIVNMTWSWSWGEPCLMFCWNVLSSYYQWSKLSDHLSGTYLITKYHHHHCYNVTNTHKYNYYQ